jgi:SAM-dependent methyltransferase
MVATSATFTGPSYYDEQLAPFTFGPFADDLVARIPATVPGPVLEIACGTGVVTRRLRERLSPTVDLVATDLSPPMLEYARARSAGRPGIAWREADAQRLPFGDGSFAAVVCGFGFMFAPDRALALREARRVLADAGLLFFSVWDRIEDNPHGLANAEVVESLFPDDPQMKFRLPYEMHDAGKLRALLAEAGFGDVHIETRRIPITGADPRLLASGQIRGTPRSALLVERGMSLDKVIADVAQALVRQGGDPYRGYGQALMVQARATK